jgi:transcriptional regulator of aromatic amino acid metabolism
METPMIEELRSKSMSASFLLRSLTSHERHPHLLLDCNEAEVECIRLGLLQWGTGPVWHIKLPGLLTLPRGRRGTLLLEGVHRMTLAQQIALYDWMTWGGKKMQVISLTTAAIDGLVASGQFLEGLFYRLNMVRLDIRSTPPPSQATAVPVQGEMS